MFILFSSLTYWLKELLHNIEEELLAGAVTKTSTTIVIFHLIKICIFRKEFCKVLICAECVKICEYHIALYVARICDI